MIISAEFSTRFGGIISNFSKYATIMNAWVRLETPFEQIDMHPDSHAKITKII